ncbi:MAG: metallopeptidase TldD-related protein, partial [Planctomycetes bacterium]|nr:metallopeptidase TldD-related protein [Planctomycetota bacterium]
MDHDHLLSAALETMRRAGADKASGTLSLSSKSELNVDAGRMSLLRTTESCRLGLTALVQNRKGSIGTNRLDGDSVAAAALEAVDLARSSPPDPANEIAPASPPMTLEYGDREPDLSAMYDRLLQFLAWSASTHPTVKLEQCILDFTGGTWRYANTNGVDLRDRTGLYRFTAMFTAKEGTKTSSFNYSGGASRGLDRPLFDWGSVATLMRQSGEQLDVGAVGGSFTGQVLITPDCLGDFVSLLDWVYLSDSSLIKGSSPFRESLNQPVASPLFTLRSAPRSVEAECFYTPDGFAAEDSAYIDKGVLEGYSLSLYGSRKTGRPKAPNSGDCWVVDAGETPLDDIVRTIDRGILLCRFSGGMPTETG